MPADHTTVQCHPLAVMEVRRILLEHLAELRAVSAGGAHGHSDWSPVSALPAMLVSR